MEPSYLKKIQERKAKGSYRSLFSLDGYTDFWSNDYLGMARRADEPATVGGSTGSRLISGNHPLAEHSESELAAFFGSEAALVFNSGYDANVGFFSAVPQKGDTVLYDELIHASVRDGIRLSYAKSFSFRHNDLNDLERKFRHATGTVFVAVESLYSMDGDVAPLKALVQWCESKQALLVVDEAHAGGVFGTGGRGLMEQFQLHQRCFARLFTFGKAYGSQGAVVCGPDSLRACLINFARSFIYTTALPAAHYAALTQRVKQVAEMDQARRQLQEMITLLRAHLSESLHFSNAHSPIQIVPVASREHCLKLAETVQQHQFAVKAILPPTVPEGGERLRICLHAFNTPDTIVALAQLLNAVAP